jgi:sugar phosphate isomerase/epimerase
MALSRLPLSYCTNVHPGRSLEEVERGLDQYTVPLAKNFGQPLAAGLWLQASVARELTNTPETLARFRDALFRRNLSCYTLNAFPFGDFHSPRVKENVYLPDWSDDRRVDYTLRCASILAELLPPDAAGSISTSPLAFKPFSHAPGHSDRCLAGVLQVARGLARLYENSGRIIRLAIEPEPCCLLETTPEVVAFFTRVNDAADRAGCRSAAKAHLGICYDVCHQAVEFEDVAQSIATIARAEIPIVKVHITCAIEVRNPLENLAARQALARYAEERYLHQTFARSPEGQIARVVDLTAELAQNPTGPFARADIWRVHFHVPVDAESLGPLGTTRGDLKQALSAIALLPDAPHLEVETYTWEVLPGEASRATNNPAPLIDGLTRELTATRELLAN